MARTKVLYFIPNLQQGGPEGQILSLINQLPARFEPVLCVYHADEIFFDGRCPPGQPAHELGVRRMNLRALDRLTDIMRREKPDIVHSYRDKANFWARLAAKRARVPITITGCRNRMMGLPYLATEWLLQRRSAVILANSIGVKRELVRWARVRANKVRVIYNLLDVDYFRPPTDAERAEARARWQLDPGSRALLLPGRVGLQKHHLGLLAAMRALARRGAWPKDVVVLFAGRERDRLTSALAHGLARHPSLEGAVRFLGAVKDIRSLYWASDVLVMPSLYEGLANAALEGCASGLPALLSKAANVDSIIRPGETGWQVPTLRHRPLVAALADVIVTPSQRLAAMGRAGRAHVAARFAPRKDHVLDQMVAVYDELLAGIRAVVTDARPAVDLERTVFDVIVVGSGFGGATTAYALSRAGLNVLLVERGGWAKRDETDWNGRAILLDGRYKGEAPLGVRQYGARAAIDSFPNEVVGGNSIFFGGAALRLRAADFARWPVGYAAFEPYYAAAEALLEVHGRAGDDPAEPPRSGDYPRPPAPLTAPARRITDAARALGLHPFQIPVAINHGGTREPRCINCVTCDGFPCRIGAKNDVTQTALAHADPDHLAIVARVLAARLVERDGRIAGIEVIDRDGGRKLTLAARVYVLSGGAIGSAALMLRSGLDARDASGALGRYLMRHCNAMIGYVFPFLINPERVNHKQICVTDLYESVRASDGTALGIIQDMCMPPREVVRALGPSGFKWAASVSADRIQSLLCIAEDEAQAENRVTSSADRRDPFDLPVAEVHHAYAAGDVRRRDILVATARKILRRAGGLVGKERLIDSFSHAVGTARFGDAPETSVLSRDCRFWTLPNLFVVDGSFMPSSGGVNPSLTITANALRVAAHIRDDFAALATNTR